MVVHTCAHFFLQRRLVIDFIELKLIRDWAVQWRRIFFAWHYSLHMNYSKKTLHCFYNDLPSPELRWHLDSWFTATGKWPSGFLYLFGRVLNKVFTLLLLYNWLECNFGVLWGCSLLSQFRQVVLSTIWEFDELETCTHLPAKDQTKWDKVGIPNALFSFWELTCFMCRPKNHF